MFEGKEIELAFDLPVDWRGIAVKFLVPILLFAMLIIALGIKAILN